MIVADFVVTEHHLAPVIRPCRDRHRRRHRLQSSTVRLCSNLSAQNLQTLHRHDGAVEELLLPLRGSDTKPVADGDLQRLDDAPVLHVAANLDDHAFGIRLPREMALAHEMR